MIYFEAPKADRTTKSINASTVMQQSAFVAAALALVVLVALLVVL